MKIEMAVELLEWMGFELTFSSGWHVYRGTYHIVQDGLDHRLPEAALTELAKCEDVMERVCQITGDACHYWDKGNGNVGEEPYTDIELISLAIERGMTIAKIKGEG